MDIGKILKVVKVAPEPFPLGVPEQGPQEPAPEKVTPLVPA